MQGRSGRRRHCSMPARVTWRTSAPVPWHWLESIATTSVVAHQVVDSRPVSFGTRSGRHLAVHCSTSKDWLMLET